MATKCSCKCVKCVVGKCDKCEAPTKCANFKPTKSFSFHESEILGETGSILAAEARQDLVKMFAQIDSSEENILEATAPFDEMYEFRPKPAVTKTTVESILQKHFVTQVLGADMMQALGEVETQRAVVAKTATATALNRAIERVADSSIAKLNFALSKKSEISNKMGVLVHDLKKNLRAKGFQLDGWESGFNSLEQNMGAFVQSALIAA